MDYHKILKEKIILIITNDLTIGRNDNDLVPYTDIEINEFIKDNNDNIEKVIEIIINDYTEDDELELLEDPLLDHIQEYLYDYVDTKTLMINDDDK